MHDKERIWTQIIFFMFYRWMNNYIKLYDNYEKYNNASIV